MDGRASGIETAVLRRPEPGRAMVVAAFCYRYDAHLVPDLIENLAPAVHGWVALDDRAAGPALSDERARRAALLAAARRLGADWILAADPDERFEDRLAERIGELVDGHGPVAWTFCCREMFEPDRYRVDGLWRSKRMLRLFPRPESLPDGAALHGGWIGRDALPMRDSGLDFYHLRMIAPARRRLRRDLYAAADAERRHQRIGYDYLADERGMTLEPIAEGRGFSPSHEDDGGLWAPAPAEMGDPAPDPPWARLALVARHLKDGGEAAASHVAEDLADEAPADPDLALLAAERALAAGRNAAALARAEAAAAAFPDLAAAHHLLGRVHAAVGDHAAARKAAARALALAPRSGLLRLLNARTRPLPERFKARDAPWRRWAEGPARIREGRDVSAEAELAVVVIALGAPRELAEAVASLRAQDVPTEIVVVNSGGGPLRRRLQEHLEAVRLIRIERPLFAGAARNIGIDASVAPVVAFLASDCLARPGWVRGRLARHRAGAHAVGTPVIPEHPDAPASLAAGALLHRGRWPTASAPPRIGRYGLSYERRLFEAHGYFATGLRTGEDTEFNRRLPAAVTIDWAPEVLTAHRYPTATLGLMRDMLVRGGRRAGHAPFPSLAGSRERGRHLSERMRREILEASAAIESLPDLPRGKRRATHALIRLGALCDRIGIALAVRRMARVRIVAEAPVLDDAASPPAQNVDHLLRCAETLAAEGRPEVVLDLLRRAVALAPAHPRALRRLCRRLARLEGPRAALAAAEAVHLQRPREPLPIALAHRYATARGDTAHATLFAQRRFLDAPDDASAHAALAAVHAAEGRDAAAAFRRHDAAQLARSD